MPYVCDRFCRKNEQTHPAYLTRRQRSSRLILIMTRDEGLGMSEALDDNWLIDDEPEAPHSSTQEPWKILIADDEPDVHSVTRLALRNIEYHGRKLDLISAYSASEAFEVLSQQPDIAVLLLDVVMETDDAGLRLVHRIREELGNQLCRIVLRTGQPGQAPEQEVIVSYDINDYKAKTELTTQKLFTTVISSLRAYESLYALENHRLGLHRIIKASSSLHHIQSLRDFASGLLRQINALLQIGMHGAICLTRRPDLPDGQNLQIIACTGVYDDLIKRDVLPAEHEARPLVERVLREKRHIHDNPIDTLYVVVQERQEFVIYLSPSLPLNEIERSLLEVFCDRISLAFDNLWLHDQVQSSQIAAVTLLSSLADTDTPEAHLKQFMQQKETVESFCLFLREQHLHEEVLSPRFIQQIGIAYLLHDLGKLTISSQIRNKPGELDSLEKECMRTHSLRGSELLKAAQGLEGASEFMSLAAEMALRHHENFDGSGYPHQLAGDDIPLCARITSLFDVYHALTHQRPYRPGWSDQQALAYIEAEAGQQFDPELAQAFLAFMRSRHPVAS